MGYKSHYKVYDETGKCIGQFSGWTGNEAIKQCLIRHPEAKGLTVKLSGSMEHRK